VVPREPRLPRGAGRHHDQPLPLAPPVGFGVDAPLHLEDEDTRNLTQEQARGLVRAAQRGSPGRPAIEGPLGGPRRREGRDAFEEPTRAVDWGTMDDLARGSPPGGRKPPAPPPGSPRRGAGMSRRPDEDTNSVEVDRVASLSEIDWDLD
jgi:hypothetical protein